MTQLVLTSLVQVIRVLVLFLFHAGRGKSRKRERLECPRQQRKQGRWTRRSQSHCLLLHPSLICLLRLNDNVKYQQDRTAKAVVAIVFYGRYSTVDR